MKNLSDRIRARLQELGMTQEELATKLGITRGAITHYLSGRRVPSLKQLQRLATVLKVNPAVLQFGAIGEDKKTNVKETKIEKFPIPILTWEDVVNFVGGNAFKNLAKEHLNYYHTTNANLYALKVIGDSMTSLVSQRKSFYEGEYIIVDSERKAENNDFVIALSPKAQAATFKQYVIDGGTYYLKPLNPQYPIIQIDKHTHICGVVVSCISLY